MSVHQDTIVARATNPGQSAISLVRVSGANAVGVVDVLTNGKTSLIKANESRLRKLSYSGKMLDEALVTVFRSPHSFTGEDVVELSLHGSDFITGGVIQALLEAGARLATPGEFTLRAFLNGKMDLAQAEGVADLIAAQTSAEHQMALNQLKGGISQKIRHLRTQLLEFASLIELELDFGEEDVEFADRQKLREMIVALQSEVTVLQESFKTGSAIREGIPVTIAGKPNAGKSTLLNALLGEERAIVTDIPGTTRDTIEETLAVGGVRFRFIDTAGIREAENKVEQIGIERTWQSVAKSALVWLLFDPFHSNSEEIEQQLADIRTHTESPVWLVASKCDPGLPVILPDITGLIAVSAKNHRIEPLLEALEAYAAKLISASSDTTISHLRHFEVLQNSSGFLSEVLSALDNGLSGDMLAHHLRNAMTELGKITGEIGTEEILGQIFSKFCIGK